jgi:hypothetical protein
MPDGPMDILRKANIPPQELPHSDLSAFEVNDGLFVNITRGRRLMGFPIDPDMRSSLRHHEGIAPEGLTPEVA